jgi:hypothetical protein
MDNKSLAPLFIMGLAFEGEERGDELFRFDNRFTIRKLMFCLSLHSEMISSGETLSLDFLA